MTRLTPHLPCLKFLGNVGMILLIAGGLASLLIICRELLLVEPGNIVGTAQDYPLEMPDSTTSALARLSTFPRNVALPFISLLALTALAGGMTMRMLLVYEEEKEHHPNTSRDSGPLDDQGCGRKCTPLLSDPPQATPPVPLAPEHTP